MEHYYSILGLTSKELYLNSKVTPSLSETIQNTVESLQCYTHVPFINCL